jgi:hypothetical protein
VIIRIGDPRHQASGLAGLETPERSEPSIWKDAWQRIGHRRHFVHREIGDPGDKGFVHCEIVISETPISGEQLSAQQRRRTVA